MKYNYLLLMFLGLATSTLLVSCNSPFPENSERDTPKITETLPPVEENKQAQKSVSITSPKGKFQCDTITENKCFFSVKGKASNLKDGDYLSVLLTSSGNTWWQGGESIKYGSVFNTEWIVMMVSVDPNGETKNWVLRAMITQKPEDPGTTWPEFPTNVIASQPINIELELVNGQ